MCEVDNFFDIFASMRHVHVIPYDSRNDLRHACAMRGSENVKIKICTPIFSYTRTNRVKRNNFLLALKSVLNKTSIHIN